MSDISSNVKKFYVVTFYKVVELDNYQDMKPEIMQVCTNLGIKGTVILSVEGINLTICCHSMDNIDKFVEFLKTDERMIDLPGPQGYRLTYCDYEPFIKMIVRLKLGVVNMGSIHVDMSYAGKKVYADEWDSLVRNDDVSVINIVNDYEGRIGNFERAIVPPRATFSEFIDWWMEVEQNMRKKLAISCTGGIRCEKAGAWLASRGFEVYNLAGGTLHYLEQRKGQPKTFHGDCFVFDDRIALSGDLKPNPKCMICGNIPSLEDLRSVSRANVVCSHCNGHSEHENHADRQEQN